MRAILGRTLVAITLSIAFASPAGANTSTPFPSGSLIIPVSSSFQDDCGAVSAYGLVYDVLRADPWLAANGYTPITIYYTYLDTKASPNRCVPTSIDTPPTASSAWNDGCDITGVSAMMIDPANHLTANTNITTYATAATTVTTNQCSGGTNSGQTCANVLSVAPDCPGTYKSGDCAPGAQPSCTTNGKANCSLNASKTGCVNANNKGSCTYNAATGSQCKGGTVNAGAACSLGTAGDQYCAESSCVAVSSGTSAKANVFPTWPSKVVTSGVTVNYLGGPFVIAASDADTFRALVDGTIRGKAASNGKCSDGTSCSTNANCSLKTTSGVCGVSGQTARDLYGNVIDFTVFTNAPGTGQNDTQSVAPTSSCSLGDDHHVNIHIATAPFTANIGKAFQSVPPRLALLGTDTNGHTGAVYNGILQTYLKNAGLSYASAGGCPPGAVNATNTTYCPNGATSGQIYDLFDFDDLANNQIAAVDGAGNPLYAMLWTPHWESTTSCTSTAASCTRTAGAGSCTLNGAQTACTPSNGTTTCQYNAAGTSCTGLSTAEQKAMTAIGSFLNGQNGLAAECASVANYEGDWTGGAANEVAGLQLQTCVDDGTGKCSASTTTFGINRNLNPPGFGFGGGGGGGGGTSGVLKNCTDPGMTNGTECAFYSYPGDSFAQTADYVWTAVSGHTASWVPNTNTSSIYRPGVVPLISAASLDTSKIGATPVPFGTCASNVAWASCMSAAALNARPMIQVDLTSRNIKDNTPGKSNVLYLAGHNQDSSVAGTKVMLETLLQLGISTLPPTQTTNEVSRNTPIVATIAGNPAVVQGTYEYVNPPSTAKTYNTSADASTFRFPTIKGHLRARTASTITSIASKFGASGVIFDAAAAIPTPTYGGCGTWYTSSCRTVFTNLASGQNPTIHYLQDSEVGGAAGATVGSSMASDLPAADQKNLIERVLAGDDSTTAGVFLPKLGGVDHSTVAVIEPSNLVNGTRPTMAYFGATDGMLHAVCASTGGNCDVVGRELWAFLPRTQLAVERYNSGRIDGSPRVTDVFGDFANTGKRGWHTVLEFQTGSGDTTSQARVPAVYALDISDPAQPKVLWEYELANVSSRGTYELGVGLTLAAGPVQINGATRNVVYAQTNNAGTGGTGSVVTAIDTETGLKIWQTGYAYPAAGTSPRAAGAGAIPNTAIPGGAVGVDKTGNGYFTDLVYATIYGDLWEVDPATGTSRYGTNKPLFSFSTDLHPIGAQPAIYSKGGIQYAVISSGAYTDTVPFDTNWTSSGTTHYVLAVSLNTPVADATINENKGSPDIGFSFAVGTGERGSSQALVVGNELFVTTDSTDVNASSYGSSVSASGHVYRFDLGSMSQESTVVVQGGVSGLANSSTAIFSGAANQTQQLATPATSTTGTSVDGQATAKVTRMLWLRTQ